VLSQLFHIKQLGSVAEYIDQFAQLVDQLNCYQPMSDPLYYTMHFLDGLRHDIKSIVMIQRPKDLDTAYVLAQLQDEIGATHKPREFSKFDPRAYSKSSQRVPMPLPPPPTGGPTTRPEVKTPTTAQPDRLSSVYAYRKAKGLCYKCGLAYSRGHTCSDTVQLHMVEELWQQFQLPQEDNVSEAGQSETLNCLHLCQSLSRDDRQSKSMRFVGEIGGLSVLILLDSGSSISFISSSIVPHVPMLSVSCPPLLVQVANVSKLSCCAELTNAEWSIQGHRFTSTLKILDLQPFDMIIGMDWLSEHSPMWVHWADKWLSLTVGSSLAKLYGVQASDGQSALVQLCSLSHLLDSDQHIIQSLPPELQSLLDRYSSGFAVPRGLPPVRDCDHRIPLIPGARPVQMRPYRYAPALKTEIEKQIDDMLGSGLIQHSKSPFSSSVILVKKKDNSYRFCVDYRHLNALTAKAKFPVPIMDEFLDELFGAAWFSTLDLRAGFHQIRMDPRDQHKTAFQTHHGHFEFCVMAFGLTGAPATFQGAMNSTLKPLLRKCALVFFDDILVYSDTWDNHLMHLDWVLQLLHQDHWQVKLSKCSFAKQKIAYLGHVISKDGVSTDPTKVEAVHSWPTPQNAKELRGFLGLAGYYRKFVKNFGVIARPLTNLLKKHTIFVWTDEHTLAFSLLKTALSSAPVLALPNFTRPFAIETDASRSGVGAVLLQDGHPLAYVSKPLGIKNMGLSAYEKEFLAILLAVDHWRSYLQHGIFQIFTDQKSRIHLNEQHLKTP
jgi:hypothetical protein